MTAASFVKTSFAGGEWGKTSQGRMEDPRYGTALARCLNIIPTEEHSAPRRPGTRHIAPTRYGATARIVPFPFNPSTPCTLEFTDGHLRFFQDAQLSTEDGSVVTDVSTANPAVVTIQDAVDWATGDEVVFTFGDDATKIACSILGHRVFRVTKLTTTTFSLHDTTTGAPLDGSTVVWASTLDLTLARVIDLATVYTAEEWKSLRAIHGDISGDPVAVLLSEKEPQILTTPDNGATFSIAAADIKDGPYLDPVEGSWITPDALDGLVNLSLSFQTYDAAKAYSLGDYVTYSGSAYKALVGSNQGNTPAVGSTYWTPASAGDAVGPSVFTTNDIGRHIRLYSEPALWDTATTYAAGNVVSYGGLYWTALKALTGMTPAAGNVNPTFPGNTTTDWSLNTTAARWTWGKVTALSTTGLIAQATGVPYSDFTSSAPIANFFDENQLQTYAVGAPTKGVRGSGARTGYLGKNFTGSPQAVSSARIFPATLVQSGITKYAFTYGGNTQDAADPSTTVTIVLRGKQTAPSSRTNGTALGTLTFHTDLTDATARTIVSNDPTTAWNYVWFDISATGYGYNSGRLAASEVEFYSSAGTPGAGVQVQILGDPLYYTSTIRTWRLGLYNNSTPKWPTNGCYHEGRLWLSGAEKNRFDGSKSNEMLNFEPTGSDGTVADNNAISYTLNASAKNEIYWLHSADQGIVVGTSGGPWIVQASAANNPLTPTSIQAHPLTAHKSADQEPVQVGAATIFTEVEGRKLFEYLPDGQAGRYFASNMSEFAKHLTVSGIKELAYQEELSPIVWACTNGGSLIGATYRRINLVSAQPPEVLGWHRHEFGWDVHHVKSICSAPTSDGTLMMVLHEHLVDKYHVNLLTNFAAEEDEIWQSWHLDHAHVPTAGAEYSSSTGIKFYGLGAREGTSLTVFAAGIDCGEFPVVGGTITVPYSGLFTKRNLTQIAATQGPFGDLGVPIDGLFTIPVLVGHTYPSQGQLLRPVSQAESGARNGPAFGKTRRVHQFAAMLHNTRDISFGTTFDNIRPALFKSPGGTAFTDTELFSGIYQGTLEDDNSFDGQICWQADGPFPATLLALGGFLSTQDK